MTASAQSNNQGILADGIGEGGDLFAFVRGFTSRYSSYGAPEDAATLADRMRNEFNANSDPWISYGNWLIEEMDVTPIGSADIAVDVALTRGRWPTVDERVETYIEVGYDEDLEEFYNLEWHNEGVDEPDYFVSIENHAAESAADELQEFRREFIDENGDDHEIPDEEYLSELAGRYMSGLRFGEDSKHVLGLLLGDTDGF